jgi:hypothetical protein
VIPWLYRHKKIVYLQQHDRLFTFTVTESLKTAREKEKSLWYSTRIFRQHNLQLPGLTRSEIIGVAFYVLLTCCFFWDTFHFNKVLTGSLTLINLPWHKKHAIYTCPA